MANKIISFGTNENFINANRDLSNPDLSALSPLEVFRDVSMESTYVNDSLSSLSPWKIQKSSNVKAIFNSLRNIFTWNRGERILLPEFGSKLRALLYEGITPQTEESIMAEIRMCVSEWEPRINIVDIVNVKNIDDTEDNVIHIQVVFVIPSLGDEQYRYSFSYTKGS